MHPDFYVECAYRRGFVHALSAATDAVRSGATAEQIAEWCDRAQDWRDTYGGSSEPPRCTLNRAEATDGTPQG